MQISSTFSFITEYIKYIREARQETDKFRDSINRTSETERNANSESGRNSRPYSARNDEYETYDRPSSQFTGNPLDYREQVEEYSSPASQRHFRTARRDIVDNSQTDDDFNYNANRDIPSKNSYSRYSQSEIISTLPVSAMGDLEKYRSLLIQREEQNRFFANKGIDPNDAGNMVFGKDRNGYDIQEDYKKRFGSDIQDTSARDKLSDDIKKTLQVLEQKSNNTFDYKNFDPYKQPEGKKSMTVQQALGKGINDLGQGVTDLTGSVVAGGLVVGAATSAIQLGTKAIQEMATTMYENNIKESVLNNLSNGDSKLVDEFVNKNKTAVTKSDALSVASMFANVGLKTEQQGMAMELAKDLAYTDANGNDFKTWGSEIATAIQNNNASEIVAMLGYNSISTESEELKPLLLKGSLSQNKDYSQAFAKIAELANAKKGGDVAEAAKENQSKDWWGSIKKLIINNPTMLTNPFSTTAYNIYKATREDKYNYDYTGGTSGSSDSSGSSGSENISNVKTGTNFLESKSNDTIAKSNQNSYMSNVNKTQTFNIYYISNGNNTEEDAKKLADNLNNNLIEEELNNVGSVNISGSR